MSGWIVLFGDITNFGQRLSRFRRIFSVDNVPQLNVETLNFSKFHNSSSSFHDSNFIIVLWSWHKECFPDVYLSSDDMGNVLLLCGAVTDLGKFGTESSDQNETARKLLALWKERGDSIIDQINGSWSLLFYNARENILTAFTDRFASRSIWISQDGKIWIIGNFPSAIVVMRGNSTSYDPAGLYSLFVISRHIQGRSLYKEVFSLIAGQKITLKGPSLLTSPSRGEDRGGDDGYCSISHWYKRRYRPDFSAKPKEWGYRLAYELRCSAKRYKKITPNPYLFLSGGLDSRIVAAAYGKDLKTITLCTSPNFESRIARLVSYYSGLKHQQIIRSPYWYLDTLMASALITSGNYLFSHTHFIVPVIEIIEDEPDASFFLGDLLENLNKHYFSIPSGSSFTFTPENLPDLLTQFIPSVSRIQNPELGIFNNKISNYLHRNWLDAIQDSAKLVMDVSEDDRDKFDTYLRWIDVSVTYTYNMITCIWPLASERNLFFDNELNDLSLQIPADIRGKSIIHKWILWHLKKELLIIPDANYFLPVFMPKWLQRFSKETRPKLGHMRRRLYTKRKREASIMPTAGSWLLFNELYRQDKRYRDSIESLLNDGTAFPFEIFDHKGIRILWQEFLNGNNSLLFDINALLTFGILNRLIPNVQFFHHNAQNS
ncbi:MAG: asparagine synthase-related protein [candidate division WOR-3 bacterium]